MKTETYEQQHVLACDGTKTQNWTAWLDTRPPKPDHLHVTGEVEVSNPGVQAILLKKVPQGINPEILLLDLHLVQQPGIWPAVISTAQARYDETLCDGQPAYKEVSILCGSDVIETIEVQVAS